jgi:hypothetical protein
VTLIRDGKIQYQLHFHAREDLDVVIVSDRPYTAGMEYVAHDPRIDSSTTWMVDEVVEAIEGERDTLRLRPKS